ncbi:Ubiquitin carboxyl-terminal hydrolase 15 [Bienertia sinuspersici]
MCELEQHVHMLRDTAGPLSPSRILSHIRSINYQIGDGSQEDAHEFLRLLVASMQSICLEEAGGENQVHPILQETTFVQQTFGGRLRSMVVCLRCHHESERYEKFLDLTLEIFGWVESLEDALTQFTTPEDLDGENMYRCGRCTTYVRARKQLNIDEAPNILTIVLKRFQEGNYGKLNKCITFPEMLDMIPYMTGINDSPPLYMLYGVVVHVDTLNASFSGHYVSYVKDLQGNWFRIDDTVVQPVSMTQVMSEGAYILFYMRSFPRPPRAFIKNAKKQQPAISSRSCSSKTQSSSKKGLDIRRSDSRFNQAMETRTYPNFMEYSDATTSDWSLFTSSDEASFTSESTRDSLSTTDYSENGSIDPFSQRMVSCRMFSGSKPVTRYVPEETGYVLDSYHAVYPLNEMQLGEFTSQFSVPFNEAFLSNGHYPNFVNYESTVSDSFIQTFTDVHL